MCMTLFVGELILADIICRQPCLITISQFAHHLGGDRHCQLGVWQGGDSLLARLKNSLRQMFIFSRSWSRRRRSRRRRRRGMSRRSRRSRRRRRMRLSILKDEMFDRMTNMGPATQWKWTSHKYISANGWLTDWVGWISVNLMSGKKIKHSVRSEV